MKKPLFPLVLSAAVFAAPVFAETADPSAGYLLAEYRADQEIDSPSPAPVWELNLGTATSTMRGAGKNDDPWDLQTEELSGSLKREIPLGPVTLRGVVDVRHLQAQWTGELYSRQRTIEMGPQFVFGPGNVTHLYLGLDRDEWLGHQFGRSGEADTARTGLSHTWYWGDRAHVRVGYEYAQGSNEELYQDMQRHSVSVSGQFPVGWGLHANLLADYGRFTYPEYNGAFGLASDRRAFRASLSRAFTERLSGDLVYSYFDEYFGTEYQKSSAFGLQLRYKY